MSRVYVEKDSRNDNGLVLKQLLEEYKTIVQGLRELLKIEPNVEGTVWGDIDVETKCVETGKNVVTFCFEMFLQSNLAETIMIDERFVYG